MKWYIHDKVLICLFDMKFQCAFSLHNPLCSVSGSIFLTIHKGTEIPGLNIYEFIMLLALRFAVTCFRLVRGWARLRGRVSWQCH